MRLTKKQKIEKILGDFKLFAKNFIKIVDNNGDLVPFVLNEQQEEFINGMTKFNIIAKARQGGFSTVALAFCLFSACVKSNTKYLIVSYKSDSSKELFERLKMMNYHLPREKFPDVFPDTKRDNRDELLLSNGSLIRCVVAGNKDVGRGSTFEWIHLSEYAFYDNQEKTLLSCEQSLAKSPTSRLVIETTSNGVGNNYFKLFMSAYKGNSKYKAFFVPFFADLYKKQFKADHDEAERWHKAYYGKRLMEKDLEEDERTLFKMGANLRFLMWRRWKLMDMQLEEFYQEYPSNPMESFISSGESVFNPALVLERIKYILSPLPKKEVENDIPQELRRYLGKQLFIYHLPKSNKRYFGGVDTATGGGGDSSTITIINSDGEEVCTFVHNKVPVYEFAEIVNTLGKYYNYAFLCIERNNVGTPLLERLRKEKGYMNLYKQKIFNQRGQKVMQLGWQTSSTTKSILIQDYKEIFEKGLILIHTKEILEQMQIYVEKDKKYGNKGGNENHDDLVISAALSVQAMKANKWYVDETT
ncbi:DNA packaging protein [Fictibacillus gelatini]|uniref:phage terminase large subunit family protein n=1 Tax=Fictibacillus gelatini TaxID=225985 RepID=UPI00041CBC03|nr:DNA packaging protein [Fictibacillus gelatini]